MYTRAKLFLLLCTNLYLCQKHLSHQFARIAGGHYDGAGKTADPGPAQNARGPGPMQISQQRSQRKLGNPEYLQKGIQKQRDSIIFCQKLLKIVFLQNHYFFLAKRGSAKIKKENSAASFCSRILAGVMLGHKPLICRHLYNMPFLAVAGCRPDNGH